VKGAGTASQSGETAADQFNSSASISSRRRHSLGDFRGNQSLLPQQMLGDTDHLMLRLIGIGDEAAVEGVGAAFDVG
jgi:hypothetical protein